MAAVALVAMFSMTSAQATPLSALQDCARDVRDDASSRMCEQVVPAVTEALGDLPTEAVEAVEEPVPSAPGGVVAAFLGTSSCSTQTDTCSWNLNGIHYVVIGAVEVGGIGTFSGTSGTPTSCVFTLVPCVTPGSVGTNIPRSLCAGDVFMVESVGLLGSYASDTTSPC